MLLERLEMENFKSFRGRHEVAFGAGLNCITGANGSGKSNILEAICFAFGESSCARLRVATMKELHSKQTKTGAQATTTRVTLHLRTRQHEPMVLSATLCARTGHRTYKLNNRITSIKLVKRHLRLQCGINVDISLWLIQQNLVHKMPNRTPVELAGYICEAGGTKLFFEYREEAQAALQGFKHSVQKIRCNIQHLTEVVQRETSVLEAHREHSENARTIISLNAGREKLHKLLTLSKLKRGKRLLASLEVDEKETMLSLESSKSAFTSLEQTAAKLLRSTAEVKEAEHNHEAVQLDLVRIGAEQEEITSRIVRLQHQLQSNSEKKHLLRQKLEKTEETMTQSAVTLSTINAKVASMQNLVMLVSTAKAQNHPPSAVVAEITRRMHEMKLEDITRTSAKLMHKLSELSRQQKQVEFIRDTATQESAAVARQLQESESECTRLCEKTSGWTEKQVESEMGSIQSRLQACEEELRDIFLHLPRLLVPLQGEGDLGLFMDHIMVKEPVDRLNAWMGALGLLVSKSLGNRICLDSQVAKKILAANDNRYSFTVWPVKNLKLQPRTVDLHLRSIHEKYGSENVVDPMDLMSVSQTTPSELVSSIMVCLRKVFGSWVLVKNDEIGRDILLKYGIPSVSTALNMHSPGMLSGGYRGKDPVFEAFTRVREVQIRREALETDISSLATIRTEIASLSTLQRGASGLEAKLQRLDLDIEEAKRDIRAIQAKCTLVEQERMALNDTAIRNIVFGEDMKAYAEAVHEHKKILDPVDIIRNDRKSSLLLEVSEKLTQLEISHSSLVTSIDQLDEETKQIENQITQLTVSSRSLNEAESTCKNQERILRQKLQHCAQYSAQYISTIQSIHQRSEQTKNLEATLEDIFNRKRTVQESIDHLQLEIDSYAEDTSDEKRSSSHTLEELEAMVRQLDEQHDALTLKQKVLQAQLSSSNLVEETVVFKQKQLARFEDQHQNLTVAIKNLEDGIQSTHERSAHANNVAFSRVERSLQDIFSRVVPTKQVELCKLGETIEAGVTFGVKGSSSDSYLAKTTKELSGGQLAMLGMAYVFALARFSSSPLYVLDEIDAALDEHNQRVVADLVLEYFDRSQVICISHHDAFHARAMQMIEVQKLETTSKVVIRKPKK